MTGFAVASFLAFGALLVLFGANGNELIEAHGLSYPDLGLLGSFLSLGLGVGIVIAGPLVDRWPRRPLLVAACGCVAAACLPLGPDTGFRSLLLHTLLIGFGAGFYETVLNALVVERHGDESPRRLVFIHAGATLAAALTPLAFEALRGWIDLAWYHTFRIAGAAHLILIAAAAFVPMDRASPWTPDRRDDGAAEPALASPTAGVAPGIAPGPGAPPDPSRGATPDPSSGATPGATSGARSGARSGATSGARGDRVALAAICVATFAYVGVESAVTLFVGDYARRDLGLDAARAAGTISAFWSGLLVGRLGVGLAPRAPGAGTTALLAAVAAALVLAFGLGWIAPPELAMAGTGFFLGGVFPVMIGLAGQALPHRTGLAVGLAGGLGSLGGFAVPWLTGGLAGTGGLAHALAALSGWLLLLVVGAAFARHRRVMVRS